MRTGDAETHSEEEHRQSPQVEVVGEQSAQSEITNLNVVVYVGFLEEAQIDSVDEFQVMQLFEQKNRIFAVPQKHNPNNLHNEKCLNSCDSFGVQTDDDAHGRKNCNKNANEIDERQNRFRKLCEWKSVNRRRQRKHRILLGNQSLVKLNFEVLRQHR